MFIITFIPRIIHTYICCTVHTVYVHTSIPHTLFHQCVVPCFQPPTYLYRNIQYIQYVHISTFLQQSNSLMTRMYKVELIYNTKRYAIHRANSTFAYLFHLYVIISLCFYSVKFIFSYIPIRIVFICTYVFLSSYQFRIGVMLH